LLGSFLKPDSILYKHSANLRTGAGHSKVCASGFLKKSPPAVSRPAQTSWAAAGRIFLQKTFSCLCQCVPGCYGLKKLACQFLKTSATTDGLVVELFQRIN
jgi:hypothetical protein